MRRTFFQSGFPTQEERRKGVALIIVLAILVLVTALVVGFLVRTGSERASAASYRATARTRQLADTVVNLVQGQINQATSPATLGGTAAWASQPGAIRTFDQLGHQSIYKLYSSPTLTTSAYTSLSTDLPATASWLTSPSLWVDLNAPSAFTISGSASLAYPVLDPRNPTGGPFAASGATAGQMDGFQVNLNVLPGLSGTTMVAPMPVQWLYVLQDGTILPPQATSTGSNVVLNPQVATAANPIVGRVAYWTDDDTCRLNINTAGDGTFWDTPHYAAPDELIMAYFSPATAEYQRYPGHPATTSLLTVLSAVNPNAFPPSTYVANYTITLPTSGAYFSYAGNGNNPYQPLAYQNLFGSGAGANFTPGLCPQYAYGGSEEATVNINNAQGSTNYGSSSNQAPANSLRLYPSVGELLFSSSVTSSGTSIARISDANANGTNAPVLTRQELETAKFFLTAHSRAPELNLFGKPRVSIWPFTIPNNGVTTSGVVVSGSVPVANSVRNTATDALLAFAATITGSSGGNGTSVFPFYFMRASNYDPYTDFNITRNAGALQNQQILAYLDNLMSQPVPGFSTGSFESKYTQTGERQILSEIFDYVRTTDTEDGVVIWNNGAGNGLGNIFGQNYNNGNAAIGYVVPVLNSLWASTSGTLEGFGTFPRPTCVTIHFVGLGHGPITSTSGTFPGINIPPQQLTAGSPNGYDTNNITTTGSVAANMVAVQAFIYVQLLMPAAARIDNGYSPVFGLSMTGLDTLTLSGTSVGFPSSTGTMDYQINLAGGLGSYGNDQYVGPLPITGETNQGAGSGCRACGTGLYNFDFYSRIITLPYKYTGLSGTNYMTLAGGGSAVLSLEDSSPKTNVIQAVALDFNTASKVKPLPFPVDANFAPGTLATSGSNVGYSAAGFLSLGRLIGSTTYSGTQSGVADVTKNDRWVLGSPYMLDQWHDTTASLVLNSPWDDPRMLCIQNVPKGAFVAHQNWGQQMAHDLFYGPGWDPYPGNAGGGKLNGAAKYSAPTGNAVVPCVRTLDTNGVTFTGGSTGDWDNGVSWVSDGPWINRADEGGATTGGSYSNTGWEYLPYYTSGNGSTTMGPGVFSPNREVPSPAMFGSLPTGVPAGLAGAAPSPNPWQTLLFRPGAVINHPGQGLPNEGKPPYTTIPDHLLLDLFWMPVAEPYAISEPFSTAGKVNLNYQILPFGYVSATTGTTPYIKRDTAIRSALQNLKIGAVPLAAVSIYKTVVGWWGQFDNADSFPGDNGGNTARLPINLDQTLQQFDTDFGNGQIFQSASEICDLYLVPMGYTLPTFATSGTGFGTWYGSDFGLVGDNVRERPYADIYSRITTKSNTFTVFFTVQELKNSPASAPNVWSEATGTVIGEYRGSTDMERYIQQNSTIPDFLTSPAATQNTSLESYYRWRVLESNQFAP